MAIARLLVLVLALSIAVPVRAALPASTLFNLVSLDLQPLYADAYGQRIVCTVFRVEHRLVSATHCFEDGKEGVYTTRYLASGRAVRPDVVKYDFTVLNTGRDRRRGLRLREKPIQIGDMIYGFGYAWGDPKIMSPGWVVGRPMATPYHDGVPLQRFQMNVIGGQSGGPVVDEDGGVISQNMMLRSWNSSGVAFGHTQELLRNVLFSL